MRRLRWIGIFLLCALALLSAWVFFAHTPSHTVIYDGTAFYPQEITINLGDSVTFINKSEEPFWPASDLHPSHLVWSEFDAHAPIAPQKAWSFTFTKSGNWRYHNHIRSSDTGTVRVRTQEGGLIAFDDCSHESNVLICLKQQVEEKLQRGDLAAALKTVGSLYEKNEQFKTSCHDMMHTIGEAAYGKFAEGAVLSLSSETAYCGYGFFHGFMDTLIIEKGDVTEAQNFCTEIDAQLSEDELAYNACYHGIGHGAVDGTGLYLRGDPLSLITPAMELCNRIAPGSNELQQCAGGIFDGLITAYREQSYGLEIDPEHIYDLCKDIQDPTFKTGCYTQMNPVTAYFGGNDVQATFSLLDHIDEDAYKGAALRTVAGTFAGPDLSEAAYDAIIEACADFEYALGERCIFGFVVRLLEFGPLEDRYKIGIDFCSRIPRSNALRTPCFASMTTYAPLSERGRLCERVSALVTPQSIDTCAF